MSDEIQFFEFWDFEAALKQVNNPFFWTHWNTVKLKFQKIALIRLRLYVQLHYIRNFLNFSVRLKKKVCKFDLVMSLKGASFQSALNRSWQNIRGFIFFDSQRKKYKSSRQGKVQEAGGKINKIT